MDELLGRYDGLWALVPLGFTFGVLGLSLLIGRLRAPARRKYRAPWRPRR